MLLACSGTYAQLDSILIEFTGIVSNNHIKLDWTLKGGYQCDGTIIQRSTDGISFENIGEIIGICGSSNKDEYYSYTDEEPVSNLVNQYRLILGNYGESRIITKSFYLFENSSVLIFPNPSKDVVNIVIDNPSRKNCLFNLYDGFGNELLFIDQREELYILNKGGLKAGVYFYRIVIDDKINSGRILFQ